MARYETPGVFDVSRPSKTGADPYGRPVITGHQPMMTDPMVKESDPSKVTNVPVTWSEPTVAAQPVQPQMVQNPAYATTEAYSEPDPQYQTSAGGYGADNSQMVNPMPPTQEYRRRSFWRRPTVIFLLILILLAGAYSAVDAFTSVGLPFYIFRKKQAAVQTQNTAPPPVQNTAPAIPSGFTQFNLPGTTLSFAYPTVWGTPAATSEPGFSKRGGTNKSDGTYAYLVNFAAKKDIQIAFTSSKFLPPARAATYYDYLQWCVGTSDAKFYKSILHFTTVAKVDTPTTTTCDQGPLTDAAKQDVTTIVQLKTKSSDGKTVLGDLYTKNLTATDLPVLRVKDTAMTNSAEVKILLGTIKISSSSNQTP
jgi:hypothetical protein